MIDWDSFWFYEEESIHKFGGVTEWAIRNFDINYNDIISGDRVLELCDFIFMTPEVNVFHKQIDHLNNKKMQNLNFRT